MIALAMFMALGGGEAVPRPVVFAPEAFAVDATRVPATFTRVMLDQHNRARAEHGLPPLAWNPQLAAAASSYAAQLAATETFAHSDGDGEQGENLWMGTQGAYAYAEMVGHWISEKRAFRRDAEAWSTTGDLADVGHYTQIVWKDTREVGCAVARGTADDYLVCRYFPAGNVVGEDPLD